ncbi:MAG TPA: acylphosphatase [Candidatus Thermoplasmatota archaeon]|nr:acylphosphatase [Candidatus Thermoplasmatota archaeon]
MKRLHLFIEGVVQGVTFRESTRRQAERHAVRGWVRNLPDGRVEAVLEGDPAAVDAVAAWCQRGPERAKVHRVEASEEPPTRKFAEFKVLR